MKTMTCQQLGGACSKEFRADTFEEIADMSKNHGMEMFRTGDVRHLDAIKDMMELMQNPVAMQEWLEKKKKEFDALPAD